MERMKHVPGNLKYSPNKRRMYLDETRFGPLVKLALGLAAVAAFALFVVAVLAPLLTGWLTGMPVSYPWEKTPEPEAAVFSPGPALTLPLESAAGLTLADPSVYNGALLFAAGETPDRCDRLLRLRPETGESEWIQPLLLYDTLRYPVEDGERILYLDMKTGGGGDIRCFTPATGEARTLCSVPSGAPMPVYEAPYLLLTVRTGEAESKLLALDVTTGESVALEVFSNTPYAYSAPSLRSGQAVYAAEDPSEPGAGLIRTVLLKDDGRYDYPAGGYVHDPKSLGDRWAYLNSDHAPEGELLLSVGGGVAKSIARGAVDFFITPSCVAYDRDGTVFAYAFADQRTYVLSPGERTCRLLFAGESYALFSDATDPAAPVLQYCKLG